MSDIKLEIQISEDKINIFKRCIRKLLDSTFIVGDKDERLYSFISRESNRQDVSEYLRMMGFDVLVDTNVKIAMLKPFEGDIDVVGLKRANTIYFSSEQYHLLLVLWEVYLENVGYNEENLVLKGDLIDKIKSYGINIDDKKMNTAMNLFKKYNLIDFDKNDTSEDAIITLYPSLQFGWDIAQFKTVANEYINGSKDIDDEIEGNDDDSEEELE